MINKLYNLKKIQTNQQLLQKQQALSSIKNIEEEIEETNKSISSTSVQSIGAIRDFKVLAIHKNTMKNHIIQLNQQKAKLFMQVKQFDILLVELNKETEQFKYLLDQEKKAKFKKLIKEEEDTAAEFVQAQWKAS